MCERCDYIEKMDQQMLAAGYPILPLFDRKKFHMKAGTCEVCTKKIETQIMKNTGICGEICRKVRDKETNEVRSQVDAGITNILNQPTGEVNLRGIQ